VTDDQRRRLAAKGQRLGRRVLRQVATIVTPDTILRGTGAFCRAPGSDREADWVLRRRDPPGGSEPAQGLDGQAMR
jgi:hypothetical protein